ncbi:MAG: sulfatase family protein [Planctomycetota bacterium]
MASLTLMILTLLATLLSVCGAESVATRSQQSPNIVVILCDDLGYGDVRCLNPAGKIATPNLDRLAADGVMMTDAHSPSGVCTPTRYGLLTGRYSWRSRLQRGVQGGMSPPLIAPDRLTIASLLKQQGYTTGCFGKWHLGMEWALKERAPAFADGIELGMDGWRVDFEKPISRGPLTAGFDEYFGISASLDMVPYTFIRQNKVAAIPTVNKAFPMMLGKPKHDTRRGPAAEDFEAHDVLPSLTREACSFIARHAPAAKQGKPFFLDLPLAAPHTPIAATAEWQGRSGINPYADFVMQTDAAIGAVLASLAEHNVDQQTLVIVTSDNGCSPEADFAALRKHGHNPNYHFRGHKADLYEGGHHVPFFARWPGKISAGSRSDRVICLVDLMATFAQIVGTELPANAGEDSSSMLDAWQITPITGPAKAASSVVAREAIVHHSVNGSFAIRQKNWKLLLTGDSGGWSDPKPGSKAAQNQPLVQLYDLATDPGERQNLQAEHPEIVERLTKLLERYVQEGRSTPGPTQKNDVVVQIWKK